jgi:hypothetical protein
LERRAEVLVSRLEWLVVWGTVGCAIPTDPDDGAGACGAAPDGGEVIPLKEAKLNIEHNATDIDTGFQGFIDSDGWSCLEVTGPDGVVLTLLGGGALGELGLTELFFESVEPEWVDVPLAEILSALPEGDYLIEGPAIEAGEPLGWTTGTALLTHDIPAGPALLAPGEGEVVPVADLVMEWGAVTETIDGDPVTVVSYQLIVEEVLDEPPLHVIGKPGLQMIVPSTTTSMTVPVEYLKPGTAYAWEVLAQEESGNQTLSSGTFSTEP